MPTLHDNRKCAGSLRLWALCAGAFLILRCLPVHGQEQPWDIVQRLKAAYLKNMPEDMSCVLNVSFPAGEDRDGFQESHPIPPLKILWKKPNCLKFAFVAGDPRGASHAEDGLNRFFGRLRRARAVDELNLSLADIIFAILEGDVNAKLIGTEKIGNCETTVAYFPSVFVVLPKGATGTGVKIWVEKGGLLPLRVRFFTDCAIFTFTIEYAPQKGKTGKNTYMLPARVVLTPDLTEKRRSAAFPVTMTITDYQINAGLTDADFE